MSSEPILASNEHIQQYRLQADTFMKSPAGQMFADSKLTTTMSIIEYLAFLDGRTCYPNLARKPLGANHESDVELKTEG